MLEVILDTETTGLSTAEKHRIVEIGCVELENQIPTNKTFHVYLNPERKVSSDAFKVHGYTDEFLSDKKTFLEISERFLNFIKNKKLIIHNAPFDLSFLNFELSLINKGKIDFSNIKIKTYNDHRMAMSFAPLGLLKPITIESSNVVSKSFPDFWDNIIQMGFQINKV